MKIGFALFIRLAFKYILIALIAWALIWKQKKTGFFFVNQAKCKKLELTKLQLFNNNCIIQNIYMWWKNGIASVLHTLKPHSKWAIATKMRQKEN